MRGVRSVLHLLIEELGGDVRPLTDAIFKLVDDLGVGGCRRDRLGVCLDPDALWLGKRHGHLERLDTLRAKGGAGSKRRGRGSERAAAR